MALGTRMQQRRALAAQWVSTNYVLADGELGLATDTGDIKIGDGTTPWNSLDVIFANTFLPLHGTADNAVLIGGISADNFATVYDLTTAATPNKAVLRDGSGKGKVVAGTASDDIVNKSQLDANLLKPVGRTITSANTLVLADANTIFVVNNSSTATQIVVTVPTNASVAFPVGTSLEIVASSAGGAKIVGASGVTVNGSIHAFPNYGTVRLVKVGTDTWYGLSLNSGRRFPKIRLANAGSNSYSAGSFYTCIPYVTEDTSANSYNPDHEWFSIPGTGLSTARRVIINKDGEYLVEVNFLQTNGAAGSLVIAKMVSDNTLTGATILGNQTSFANNNMSVQRRFTAGESVGAAFQCPSGGATDIADGTSSNSCDFKVTRLSD